ncbi:MAG: restriction endonuclease subunit S [Bacteroidales bacterium]|nr:restriction endonuclease subunit S [Bacteroidales bacterium]MDY2704776.1 restriction endonuclease subunit S [Alloprevotella sp.]
MRFPEFSGEWEKCKLEDCVDFLDGLRKPIKSEDRKCEMGLYPYYGASGIIDYIDEYIFDGDYILLSEDGANILDRNYRIAFLAKGKIWVNNHAHVLLPHTNIDIDFLSEALERLNYAVYNTGTTMPKLNQEVCRTIGLYIPPIKEQNKIGALLSLLNERIATQNKIIEKLQSLIKGIYDKILWQGYKQTSLSGILDERNERTTINNQYQVLSSTAKGLYRQSDYFDKEVASVNNIGYKVLRLGDIVLSPQNLWLGNINYNDAFEIGIVSPSYKVFSIKEDYNPYFVSCFLKTPKALYEYANASEQGASIVRRNLDINAFMAICFPMPDRIMQDKVSERLRAINMKFDIEKQILEKLNIEKQYLLRQMFI